MEQEGLGREIEIYNKPADRETEPLVPSTPPAALYRKFRVPGFFACDISCCHMQKSHDLIPANSRITSVSFHTEESAHLTSKGSRWNKKALVEKLKFIINRLIGKQNRFFLPHNQQRCTKSSGFRAFLHVTCRHMQKSHDLIPANSRITSVSFHTEESAHLTSKGSRWNKKALVEKLKFIMNRLIGKQNRFFLPHNQQRSTKSSGLEGSHNS